MTKAAERKDLCVNCKNIPECSLHNSTDKPVQHCNEYECLPGGSGLNLASNPNAMMEKNSRQYKGLCMNCENRETCNRPQPEGGICHCEEYR
ncbi:MAG: hypothetical protein HY811_07020 [Planctomycetes bacterium]|nr:hypothetical protein [Planctomycetota bacterium]